MPVPCNTTSGHTLAAHAWRVIRHEDENGGAITAVVRELFNHI